MKLFTLQVSILIFLSACSNAPEKEDNNYKGPTIPAPPVIPFQVTRTLPHDTNAFTEGFLFHNEVLFESTGATSELPQTRSLFGAVDTSTGRIKVKAELDREKYFGEGIAFLNGRVYQLTYQTKIGFVYDAKTFSKLGQFAIPADEGWGMTTDGKFLIMSDGTNTIRWLDPNTLLVVKTLEVSESGYAKDYLNELEFVNGSLYANVWMTNTIVRIDTSTGMITGTMDLSQLAADAKKIHPQTREMNGIAFNSSNKKFLVTGKMWPTMYEIEFPF